MFYTDGWDALMQINFLLGVGSFNKMLSSATGCPRKNVAVGYSYRSATATFILGHPVARGSKQETATERELG